MKARYYTEDEITALIDKCHCNSLGALKQAEALKDQYKAAQIHFARSCDNPDPALLEVHRQELIALKSKWLQLEKYAANQIEKKAAKLRDKLAEMRTPMFTKFNQRDSKLLRTLDKSVPSL